MDKITKLADLVSYSIAALRRRGIAFLWTYFIESIWFDWKHRTNTSVRVPKTAQEVSATNNEKSDGLLYVASFTSVVKKSVRAAKEYLGPRIFEDTQFIDIGCGKGKTVLQFALDEHSQQDWMVTGIEYDGALAEIARLNIEKCNLTERVVIHTASALDVCEYVDSGFVLFYLYNSFQGETLRQFLTAVRHIRHCLIYVDPVERDTLTKDFGYETIEDCVGRYHADTWMLLVSESMRATIDDDRTQT